MKVLSILKSSLILLVELAIFIVALAWFYNCNYNNGDCHEPLIAVIGSSLPLIVSLSLLIVDWFKRSEIQIYCENIYKQFKNVRPPLVSKQAFQNSEPDYSLPRSIPISDIYIDLPLQTLRQSTDPPSPKRNKARIPNYKTVNIFQIVKRFWGKKPNQKKNTFFEDGIKSHIDFTSSSMISTSSVSSILEKGKKTIIVGDRGCGKSTLLNYLAYTYSYQIADPKNFNRDTTGHLPKIKWIPIVVNCGTLNLISSPNFSVILQHYLSGINLYAEQTNALYEKIFSELNTGKVLLLIDGIDEIRDLDLRKQFCISLNDFVQTYPKITVIITCIESIFISIKTCFADFFGVMKISKLTHDHKKRFIQQWAQKIDQKAEFIEDLQNAIITSRNLDGLTNNIQALSLIIQLPNINSLLQDNFATILHRVIDLLIKNSEKQLNKTLNINEVTINLSEVALFMSNDKSNSIEKKEIIKIISTNSQLGITNSDYEPHSPDLLLKIFSKHIGILEEVTYRVFDSTGIDERTFYKFVHPTFHDFFRVQGMMRHFNMDEVLSQLGIPDESTASVNINPVSDGDVSSISKLVFSEMPPEKAEEVLLSILYPQTQISVKKLRIRAIFGANLLTTTSSVSEYIAITVINALLESINPDIDCKGNTLKTPLDEAVYNLLHSPWSDVFGVSLVEAFINCVGDKRVAIGSIISIEIIDKIDDLKSLSIQDLCTMIYPLPRKSETEQVFDRLKLMSIAFDQYRGAYSGYFDNPDTKKLYDLLLNFNNASEAVQMASVWALGWILNARDSRFMPKIKLNEVHVSILLEYLSHSNNDSRGLYWAALCLSRCEPIQLQPDWIYEWATVADSHRPQSDLSLPILYRIKIIDKIVNVLKNILSSGYYSLAKEAAALTLGRLGHYPDEAEVLFLRIFEDSKYTEATRQEALSYLVQIKDKAVAQQIHSIYKSAFADKNEFKSNYTYLALLAIGNVDILKEIIFQGITDLYEVGSMHSAFFALKTNKNQNNARELLKELNKSVNPEIRELSKIALMDFTGQSKTQVVQTVLTQLVESELGEDVSGELADRTVCILLVRGENPDGEAMFAYVAIRVDKLQEFMEAQKSGVFYPEDYGVIIESGEGEPTEEIRKKMEDEYGFNHEVMIEL